MAITVSLRKFIGLIAYPPGTIYTCASDIDPAEMWGGEWEKLTGTFLWAADEERPLGSIGGEVEHKLSLLELPNAIWHSVAGAVDGGVKTIFSKGSNYGANTQATNMDQPHNNMPPYLSVNMWKRLTAFSSEGGVLHRLLTALPRKEVQLCLI